MAVPCLAQLHLTVQYRYIALFLKRRQVSAVRPPRRGEGSRGSVSENANANAVGRRVRQSGAHVRTCHLACAARLLNRSSSPSGAPPAHPGAITPSCQNAPRERKISLAWTNFSSHGRYLEHRPTGLQSGRKGLGWGSGRSGTVRVDQYVIRINT